MEGAEGRQKKIFVLPFADAMILGNMHSHMYTHIAVLSLQGSYEMYYHFWVTDEQSEAQAWIPTPRLQAQRPCIKACRSGAQNPRSPWELTEPHCNSCQRLPEPTGQLDPQMRKTTHPNQSPNASLPGMSPFVLRL